MWHVKDVGDVILIFFECNAIYVKDVKYNQILCKLKHVGNVGDRSSTPKGCNAIYVGDVRDCNKSSIYIGFDGMVEKP